MTLQTKLKMHECIERWAPGGHLTLIGGCHLVSCDLVYRPRAPGMLHISDNHMPHSYLPFFDSPPQEQNRSRPPPLHDNPNDEVSNTEAMHLMPTAYMNSHLWLPAALCFDSHCSVKN